MDISSIRLSCAGNTAVSINNEQMAGATLNERDIQETSIDMAPEQPSSARCNEIIEDACVAGTIVGGDSTEVRSCWCPSKLCCCCQGCNHEPETEPNDEENDRVLMKLFDSKLEFQIPQPDVDEINS